MLYYNVHHTNAKEINYIYTENLEQLGTKEKCLSYAYLRFWLRLAQNSSDAKVKLQCGP